MFVQLKSEKVANLQWHLLHLFDCPLKTPKQLKENSYPILKLFMVYMVTQENTSHS